MTTAELHLVEELADVGDLTDEHFSMLTPADILTRCRDLQW